MSNPLLSFIIPVYNCESYLADCLNSIYGAGLAEEMFQVVLVNDGSPDKSADICKEWAERYANIVYLEQRNQGASTARNTGLKAAQGEWVWFVDSDDEVVPSFLAAMMPRLAADEQTEVFYFRYCEVYSDHVSPIEYIPKEEKMDGKGYFQKYSDGYLWNKIYRRSA